MTITPPFEIGRTYRRGELHDAFGGQRQGGISTPRNQPLILLFTGGTGRRHGYDDKWEADGRFRLYGEGQRGDMEMNHGNRAILDHAKDGRDLHLFEMLDRIGNVRYLGQMVCDSVEEISDAPDHNDTPRRAYAFMLLPLEDLGGTPSIPLTATGTITEDIAESNGLWGLDWDRLRAAADEEAPIGKGLRTTSRTVHHRSEAVKVYVQRRADGKCEGCGQPAPFNTPQGRPYLEPHHTRRISDGGPDHRAWVVAVCPNCHRRAHYAVDGPSFNSILKNKANSLEKTPD